MPLNPYYNPAVQNPLSPLSNFEKQFLRTFCGFPTLVGTNPEFDSILNGIDGYYVWDGGVLITQVRYCLGRLIDLDYQIKNFSVIPITMATENTDYARQEIMWRYVTGPSLVQELSIIMSFPIPANYFAPAPTTGYGHQRYRRIQNAG